MWELKKYDQKRLWQIFYQFDEVEREVLDKTIIVYDEVVEVLDDLYFVILMLQSLEHIQLLYELDDVGLVEQVELEDDVRAVLIDLSHTEEEDDDMVDEVVRVIDEVDEVDDIMLVVDVLVNDTIELLGVMIALTVLDEVDDEPEVLDMLERAQHYDELDEMVC